MKNIFLAGLVIGVIYFLESCQNDCKGIGGYACNGPNSTKKYAFKPGSYWVYLDSVSGSIDSQLVYYYYGQSNVVVNWEYGSFEAQCPIYADTFQMGAANFLNGALYDTIYTSNTCNDCYAYNSINPQWGYFYSNTGSSTNTFTNFRVLGNTFSKVYCTTTSNIVVETYFADSIGIVKLVFNDTINGQHTWNLLRYHVINP